MDTYGGAVNDADDIRTRILDFEIPIYVWINKDAASAGALISIACDSIYMSSGASIGAATVVTGDGAQAPDKYQSYMRSIMRSTAEAKGRDPKIAEAMVDEDIKVDSSSFLKAIWTVLLADFTMSLDNVLGVAGAAGEHYGLLVFGLVLSIVLMATAATLISGWIKKYRWIAWLGLLAILIVAVELIYTDIKILFF